MEVGMKNGINQNFTKGALLVNEDLSRRTAAGRSIVATSVTADLCEGV